MEVGDFATGSPVNRDNLGHQNKVIYHHLLGGRTIHVHTALRLYDILHLHSRISDLRNRHRIPIYDRTISVRNSRGLLVSVKEYSLTPFFIPADRPASADESPFVT